MRLARRQHPSARDRQSNSRVRMQWPGAQAIASDRRPAFSKDISVPDQPLFAFHPPSALCIKIEVVAARAYRRRVLRECTACMHLQSFNAVCFPAI